MSSKTTTKHPYHPPQLTRYGDVKDLTQTVALAGNLDGPIDLNPNRTN